MPLRMREKKELTILISWARIHGYAPSRGGGGSHIQSTGVLVGNFVKNTLEVPRACWWAWLEIFFSPVKQQIN